MSGIPSASPRVHGWWRRNIWGLVALLPLIVGTFAFNAGLFYDRNVLRRPTSPIVVAANQPVRYHDARIRLISLTEVEPTRQIVGEGHTLPAGVTIWRSVVEVDAPEESLISTGYLYLEDTLGRLYSASPSHLQGTAAVAFGGLSADREIDLDNPDAPRPNPYTSTRYYVMPSTVRPVGVRVVHTLELPRYVLFTTR